MRLWKMVITQEHSISECVTMAETRTQAEQQVLNTVTGSVVSYQIRAFDDTDVIHVAQYKRK